MSKTKIEWADKVWNPVTGCTKVSEGCRNCYAERMARRLAGRFGYPPIPNHFDVVQHPDKLEEPLQWKKPSMIFVDSMGDLFHSSVPKPLLAQVFAIMAIARQHTFLILTKRPERMCEVLDDINFSYDVEEFQEHICGEHDWCPQDFDWPLPNVWLGVSVEDQKTANERIPWLLEIPAAVSFVSIEPMLGPVDLYNYFGSGQQCYTLTEPLDWVIAGGESGPGHRPHPSYGIVRFLRDQCVQAGLPFYLKQMWGRKMPELDGRIWDQVPVIEHE